jgi:hypothetical protein
MTWTLSNLIIQLITGIVGGNAAAAIAKEHGFGIFGHSVAGAAGGGLSGYFLQTVVTLFIGSGGGFVEATPVENAIIQGLAGAGAGAVVMLAVGFLKHSIDQHRAQKP